MISDVIKITNEARKEIKSIPENLVSLTPYNKSDSNNSATASKK